MGDLVIYENDMNKLNFGSFTKVDMNFFMALCYFMKNKGTTIFSISFSELKEKANFSQTETKDFLAALNHMVDQVLKVNSTIIQKTESGKRRIYKFDIFPTFVIDEEKNLLEVGVNEHYAWLLNEFKNYTSMDLDEIVGFKSKYTKNLFRFIRQWKSRGVLKIAGEEHIRDFREKIGVKDTYRNAEMKRRCLDPAVKEINDSDGSIKNLTYHFEYANSRRGKPIKAIVFNWDKITSKEKSTAGTNGITEDSIYYIVQEALKGENGFKESDIRSIAMSAKKYGVQEVDVKQRIAYALRQDKVLNMTGYIVSLMKEFNTPVENSNSFSNFENQNTDIDFDALERELTGGASSEEPQKLTGIIKDSRAYTERKVDTAENLSQQERLKELMDIMRNAFDKG